MRLLIGMAPTGWQYGRATAKSAAYFLAQHLDYDPAASPVLQRLEQHRRAGRLHLSLRLVRAGRLHAKLYLWTAQQGTQGALVGSSNLSDSGLSEQGELNVYVQRPDALQHLERWFAERWQEPHSYAVSSVLRDAQNLWTPAPSVARQERKRGTMRRRLQQELIKLLVGAVLLIGLYLTLSRTFL